MAVVDHCLQKNSRAADRGYFYWCRSAGRKAKRRPDASLCRAGISLVTIALIKIRELQNAVTSPHKREIQVQVLVRAERSGWCKSSTLTVPCSTIAPKN